MQQLIVLETLANGTQHTFNIAQLPVITAQNKARYILIDSKSGKAPDGVKLQRDGDHLKILVNDETVLQINDFYHDEVIAQFSSEGSVVNTDNALITTENNVSENLTGASSGDPFSNITTSQSIYSLAMLGVVGVGVNSEIRNDNDEDDHAVPSAPTPVFTSATYDPITNTITVKGLNLESLLASGESNATNIKSKLDWSRLQWDFDSDNTDNTTFTEADIISAIVTGDTSLTIQLSDTIATQIEETPGFDALDVSDQIEMYSGFSRDTANGAGAFMSFPGAEANVVFDLIGGHSSWHSARIFDANTTYTIYIIVDSTLPTVTLDQSEVWQGAVNLGEDDIILLMGNGTSVTGAQGGFVDALPHEDFGYVWQTSAVNGVAAIFRHSGFFTRVAAVSISDSTRLFVASVLNQSFQLDAAGGGDSIPTGILTSQGLV